MVKPKALAVFGLAVIDHSPRQVLSRIRINGNSNPERVHRHHEIGFDPLFHGKPEPRSSTTQDMLDDEKRAPGDITLCKKRLDGPSCDLYLWILGQDSPLETIPANFVNPGTGR